MEILPLFNSSESIENTSTVHVALGDHSYDITIGYDILSKTNIVWKQLSLSDKVLIITSKNIYDTYGDDLMSAFSVLGIEPILHFIPQGEKYKNASELQKVYDILVEQKFPRDSAILAFGGGVIGDLAGYAAATYMRGIPFIQVPTTLLSQVDSSVGGKTAINHAKGKNLIGAFYQPKAVIIDTKVLATLPEREIRTGLAEIIKYGIIDDPELFSYLEQNVENLQLFSENKKSIWKHIIEKSCSIKSKVVSVDEKESGLRAILNFGHTAGHAFESLTNYERYNHGEAIAIGMVVASEMAHKRGMIDSETFVKIESLIRSLGLDTTFSKLETQQIIDKIKLDKKVQKGKVRFVLPKKLGFVDIFNDIKEDELVSAINRVRVD